MNDFIYFAKTHPNAIIPSKREEDAGYDIYPCFELESLRINPGEIVLISTGIATAFSNEFVLFIKERSSSGSIGLSLRMGVVDSGYRGEINIAVNNTTNVPIIINKLVKTIERTDEYVMYPYKKAIAQAVLCKIPKLEVQEIAYNDLLKIGSQRGVSFMGSSGK